MFEELFGLTKRPFGSQATSSDVFIGPQTAGLITRAKKVFAEPDGAMSVSGPVGSGKTTIVHRALSALGRQHTVIVIGRIKLGPDDVIEFLLRELGLKEMPAGTIQKLTVFRAILKKLAENDIRLFVIVEDAERLGNVALAELEALTATDSGVSEGANLVLMSETSLKEAFKAAPGLARLRQRTRLHYEVKPLSAPEVRGYLTNGLRQAGGDISKIIDEDAILAIHALSEGIPRVINGLVSSSLDAVADGGAARLDLATLKRVADDEYGLALDDLETRIASAAPAAPAPAEVEPPAAEAAQPEPAATEQQDEAPSETTIEDTQPTKILRDKIPEPEPEPELIQDTLPEVQALSSGEYPIPELIQDTLPDLEVLAPELAKSALGGDAADEPIPEASPEPEIPELIQDTLETPTLAVEAEEPEIPELIQDTLETPTLDVAAAEPATTPSDDEIPTLFDSSPGMKSPAAAPAEKPQAPAAPKDAATAEAPPKEVPAWDRDPTMAELKPDLEALEHAMAVAQGLADEDEEEPEQEVAEDEVEEIPEITLDDSIRRKIDIAEEMLKASTQSLEQIDGAEAGGEDLSSTVAEDLSKVPTRADEELERIASELAKAKTIEDVDDQMAETLFGEEFTMIAAELAANAPQSEPEEEAPSAPTADELSLAETGTSLQSPAKAAPAEPVSESSFEEEFKEVYGEDALEVSMETPQGGMDLSASQRLATVRALNASTTPAGGKAGASSKPKGPEPEPIEDQINTSITQTLKALSAKQIEEAQAEEQEEEKSGFFSRFRKS